MTQTPPAAVCDLPHISRLAGLDIFAAATPALSVTTAAAVVVVISRARDPQREIDLQRCGSDGIPVVVRPTGGGAVVLAPGVVVASVVTPTGDERLPAPHFSRFCRQAISALALCGVRGVEVRGVSDLCLGDRKVAGSSLRLWRDLVLFQVSFLVNMDLSLIERYLRMPSRAPAYRQGRPHLDFVQNLCDARADLSPAELASALEEAFVPTAAPVTW